MSTFADLPQRPSSCPAHPPISSTVTAPCTLPLLSGVSILLVPGQCVYCQISAQLKEPELESEQEEFPESDECQRYPTSPIFIILDAVLSALEAIKSSFKFGVGVVWAGVAKLVSGIRLDGMVDDE